MFIVPGDFADKYPILYEYLQASYLDYIMGTPGKITEMLHSDNLVNSLILNSARYEEGRLTSETFNSIVDATIYGFGPEIMISHDLDAGEGNYVSYEAAGTIYLSEKGILELENAMTTEDKQAALTYLVSTIFHEYLEQFTDDNIPSLTGQTERQGAAIMEEQVWGINIFGIEGGKEAIKILQGEKPYFWNNGTDEPFYFEDRSAIPNVPGTK
jgi:hypothetical protein